MKPKVTVIGSINLDVCIQTHQFPKVGETVFANKINQFPGGKGANQAVAAARLGAEVTLIGAVGEDAAGRFLINHLEQEEINLSYCQKISDKPTATAYILSANGSNSIIVAQGANQCMTCGYIDRIQDKLLQSDIILLQLEIPLATVWHICEIAHHHHIPVILNPAPAQVIPDQVFQQIRVITPNEHEILSIIEPKQKAEQIEDVFAQLKEKVIMTNGSKGVLYYQKKQIQTRPAHEIEVVDTTGAGDVFNGALATFWQKGQEEAINMANAAAALSTTKLGAQSGAPTYSELQQFLKSYSS